MIKEGLDRIGAYHYGWRKDTGRVGGKTVGGVVGGRGDPDLKKNTKVFKK